MRLITALFSIPILTWSWLWAWTYPLARPAIIEAKASVSEAGSVSGLLDMVRFAVTLPLMARSQHMAERTEHTSTALEAGTNAEAVEHIAHVSRWRSEPRWRSSLRESIIWSTLVLWVATWGAIGASVTFTGDFLFETHATPDSPGYVSNYFKVAALTFALPFAAVPIGLSVLGLTRRSA